MSFGRERNGAGGHTSARFVSSGRSASVKYVITSPQHRGHPVCMYPCKSSDDTASDRLHPAHRTSWRGADG